MPRKRVAFLSSRHSSNPIYNPYLLLCASRCSHRRYYKQMSSESDPAATVLESSVESGRSNFIRDIIIQDIKAGKHGGRGQTRFPPESNGYLHIGHAKAICLDFRLARQFGGQCNLRMDDTNPTKEDVEYVDSILADVKWLIAGWADHCLTLKPAGPPPTPRHPAG